MNNISFQGKTNLKFNTSIYNKVLSQKTGIALTNLNITNSSKCKIHNARIITYDPNENAATGVLLLNEKKGMFFHNAEGKINEIIEYVTELQQTARNKLTAWIIGGYRSEKTTNDINKLAEVLCDRGDIDTSIIAGQNSIAPNITLHHTVERLEVNLGIPAPKKGENVENYLENYFDVVELNNTSIS